MRECISLFQNGSRIERAANYIIQSDKLLDVGCGEGLLVFEIANIVKNIYGVDFSLKATIKARKLGIRTKLCDLNLKKLPYRNNVFNIVTCLDVIEHINNPQLLLYEIYRCLKRKGILILTTPNIRFSDHLISLILYGKFPKTSDDTSLYDGGHIHFFTYSDIRYLLERAKFRILVEDIIINKARRGWKGRLGEIMFGKHLMREFRSQGILTVAKKL